jgi:catechol 2,3-dioxygenase-like lactoylglutathione lyase family enzyme
MLQHVTLEVPKARWEETVAFWGLIGFDPMQPPRSLRERFTWVTKDDTQIHLADVDTPICMDVGHVAVLPDDYDAAVGRLREAGFEPTPGARAWDADRVFVRDPVGNMIELMSAPPLPPWPADEA